MEPKKEKKDIIGSWISALERLEKGNDNDPNRPVSMDETMKTERLRFKVNIIFCVAVIAVFIIASFFGSDGGDIKLDIGDVTFEVYSEDIEDYSFVVDFHDITGIDFIREFEIGNVISGGETETCIYGTRENSEFGTYELCISPEIDVYILITTDEKDYIFNIDNGRVTMDLSVALADLLIEEGYLPESAAVVIETDE